MELLIASTLSSVIIILLFNYYGVISKNYMWIEQLSETINNNNYLFFSLGNYFSTKEKLQFLPPHDDETKLLNNSSNSDVLVLQKKLNGHELKTFFYIAKDNGNQFGFYVKELGKPRIELTNNILNMRLMFATKCKNSINVCNYVLSKDVIDWSEVVAVKIKLNIMINRHLTKTIRMYYALKPSSR